MNASLQSCPYFIRLYIWRGEGTIYKLLFHLQHCQQHTTNTNSISKYWPLSVISCSINCYHIVFPWTEHHSIMKTKRIMYNSLPFPWIYNQWIISLIQFPFRVLVIVLHCSHATDMILFQFKDFFRYSSVNMLLKLAQVWC